jgi:3-phosphoshikimate 1-carboxyvinyltransferase
VQPLPERLAVAPRGPLAARVRVPGSKSITNRVLLIAALADGDSELEGALASDDTRVMRDALTALGCAIELGGESWRVRGCGGALRAPREPLWVGNSGTTARFLTAAGALADGPLVIDGSPRMRERPIDDLTRALGALGVPVEILGSGGCPPLRVGGGGLPGGEVTVDASRSSQYVSALLLAAPFAARDLALRFADGVLVSRPYVELTLQVMHAFGAEATWSDGGKGLAVRAGHPYRGRRFSVEPDASAAAYPFCAAAIAGGQVRVDGIPADSVQADFALLAILERMGCRVRRGEDFAEVTGPSGPLRGVDVDMNDLPDAVLALAVAALFAEGETCIRNVANLRIKETDRLAALEAELRKLGADARAGKDSLRIAPGPPRAAEIETYDDHRMAMAFALAGLRIPGVAILDPGCVSKTWPEYFSVLESL